MQANVAIAAGKSNLKGNVLGLDTPKMRSIQFGINELLKAKFKNNIWAYLAVLLRLKERGLGDKVAKHRVAGTREYNVEDISLLLRSDMGFDVLKVLLGDDKKRWPSWFKIIVAQVKQAKAMTDIRQAQLAFEEWQQEAAAQAAKLAEDA